VILESQALQAANPQISQETVKARASLRRTQAVRRSQQARRARAATKPDSVAPSANYARITRRGPGLVRNPLHPRRKSGRGTRGALREIGRGNHPDRRQRDTLTDAESIDNLLCKKSIQLTNPLSWLTALILTVAHNKRLLTDIESTIFPLPAAA
jgi:hypothetical protein